jgi:uncharacterized protein YjbI with pentapeptide repeats
VSDKEEPDDSEPTPERQAELRAAYDANVAAGKAPYEGVRIRTLDELSWIMRERDWSGEQYARGRDRANLSGAFLEAANLSGVYLWLADLSGARLERANLSGAHLYGANLSGAFLEAANLSGAYLRDAALSGADLGWATLSGAELVGANLSGAMLQRANLSGAMLQRATLNGTNLLDATLSGANLRGTRMNADTYLTGAKLDARTRLADIVWNGALVTRLNWEDVDRLGEEYLVWQTRGRITVRETNGETELVTVLEVPKNKVERLRDFQDAVLANRQVATLLRSQGLNEHADRFAYRAQVLQREVFWRQRQWGGWFLLALLWLLSGYGYRLWRILAAYGAVLLIFMLVYWRMGVHSFPHEPGLQAMWDSFLVSLSAIHGRTTFEQLSAWSPTAWAAAVESVVGIIIEGVFVAMLVQRFFAR